MIESALHFMTKLIMHTFNVILDTGKFPESWKEGIVIHFIRLEVRLTPIITEELL